MKNFVLIGVSGYVAKKHLLAIKNSNNNLIAAYDVNKNLSILKDLFPRCKFINKIKSLKKFILESKKKINYLTVCSPNHLHYKHIKFGIEMGLNVICEKPIVLNLIQFNKLMKLTKIKNNKINSILQLRHHPSLIKLKQKVNQTNKIHKVDLLYYTERDQKYFKTWKGNNKKSGGIMLNVGVHFFDLLMWIFGGVENSKIFLLNQQNAKGLLKLKKAEITWNLSVKSIKNKNNKNLNVFRSIKIDGKEIKFSKTFDDLHLLNYKYILNSEKSNLEEAFKSIQLINELKKKYNAI